MDNSHNKKWWIFFGISLMILLVNIDMTIVNLALATIANNFQIDLTKIQWVINSYVLTTIMFFIFGGKLSHIYGRRKIFLLGTILFGIASLIAGLAENFPILIIARLLQGIGFAFTLSLAVLIISDVFPAYQRGFILGLLITITGLGQALGPTVGGLILHWLTWHWIFLINVPITILSFMLIFIFVKEHSSSTTREKIDYLGAILLGFGLAVLLITLNMSSWKQFDYRWLILGILLCFFIFYLFYRQEIKNEFPLFDFNLFKHHNYVLTMMIRFFSMYALGNFLFFIPLYLQNILEYSSIKSGLILLMYSVFIAIISPFSGIWCDRAGCKRPIIFAAFVGLLALILLASINSHSLFVIFLLGLIAFGISVGIIVPSTVNSILSSLPKANVGEGTGMFFTIAFVGVSLGVVVSSVQMNFSSIEHLQNIQQTLNGISPAALSMLQHVSKGTEPLTQLKLFFTAEHLPTAAKIATKSFVNGFSNIMWLNTILAVIMLLCSFYLKKLPSAKK